MLIFQSKYECSAGVEKEIYCCMFVRVKNFSLRKLVFIESNDEVLQECIQGIKKFMLKKNFKFAEIFRVKARVKVDAIF